MIEKRMIIVDWIVVLEKLIEQETDLFDGLINLDN